MFTSFSPYCAAHWPKMVSEVLKLESAPVFTCCTCTWTCICRPLPCALDICLCIIILSNVLHPSCILLCHTRACPYSMYKVCRYIFQVLTSLYFGCKAIQHNWLLCWCYVCIHFCYRDSVLIMYKGTAIGKGVFIVKKDGTRYTIICAYNLHLCM